MLALLIVQAVAAPSETFLRQVVAETALTQLRRPDTTWQTAQRDCAGLVRFAYRSAYRRLEPERVAAGLWRDGAGQAISFADAATLLAANFVGLGRDDVGRKQLKSGDLVAFRQAADGDDEPDYHLMLVVLPIATDVEAAWVVYHPGVPHDAVRVGGLRQLQREAPPHWRPVPENPAFLGYFRFKEWAHAAKS